MCEQKKIKELKDRIKRLEDERKSYCESEILEERIDELERHNDKLEDSIERITGSWASMRDECGKLGEKLEESRGWFSLAQDHISDQRRELRDHVAEISKLQESLRISKNQLRLVREDYVGASKQYVTYHRAVNHMSFWDRVLFLFGCGF